MIGNLQLHCDIFEHFKSSRCFLGNVTTASNILSTPNRAPATLNWSGSLIICILCIKSTEQILFWVYITSRFMRTCNDYDLLRSSFFCPVILISDMSCLFISSFIFWYYPFLSPYLKNFFIDLDLIDNIVSFSHLFSFLPSADITHYESYTAFMRCKVCNLKVTDFLHSIFLNRWRNNPWTAVRSDSSHSTQKIWKVGLGWEVLAEPHKTVFCWK